jgi:hypothetical protein
MDAELRAQARRRGMSDVELVRDALARDFGRMQARDEMTELRKAVSELTRAVTGIHRDLRLLLQRLPRVW